MGFFNALGNLAKKAVPIAATIVGGPAAGAIAGGVMGAWNARNQAKAQEAAAAAAGQTAMGGFNYLQGSPIGSAYLPTGGAATQAMSGLLGLNPAAAPGAQAGFNNYLSTIGFQDQLSEGADAILGSAAADGALGSGSTLRALERFRTGLRAQQFNNYLGQLGGLSQQGLSAGSLIGSAAQSGAAQAAQYGYGGQMAAADSRAFGWDQLIGGLGEAYDTWQAGRTPPTPAIPRAPTPAMLPNPLRNYRLPAPPQGALPGPVL